MPFFTAEDGTSIYYKDLGAGPPVLLVHAWSLSSAMWEYQIQSLLAAGHRCIAMDRRGHGRSDTSAGDDDMDTLADDLATLIERLDLRDAAVIAHSMGTCEVTRYLARHGGDRVDRVVFLGAMTPHFAGAVGLDVVEGLFAALRQDRARWFEESAAAYFATSGSGAWVSDATIADGVRTILQTPLEVQVASFRTLATTDLTDDLRRIDVPVLLLHGDADVSAPLEVTGRPTSELLPRARLHVLDAAGHGLYVSDKARIDPMLLDFLAEVDPVDPARPAAAAPRAGR